MVALCNRATIMKKTLIQRAAELMMNMHHLECGLVHIDHILEASPVIKMWPARLPASVIVPRTVAAVTGNIMHSLPTLNQPGVPLTTSNFVSQLHSSVCSSSMICYIQKKYGDKV